MENITIKIEEEVCSYLQRLEYEITARRSVISFMIHKEMDIKSETFEAYHKELIELLAEFELVKSEAIQKYIPKDGKFERWSLDYATNILTIRTLEVKE